MKRLGILILLAALLCACTSAPAAPVVEPDARAQQTLPPAIEEDVVNQTATEAPAADTPEPSAPVTDAPATEAPQPQGFAARVAAAWEAEGLLDAFIAYSDADVLDMYGVDLSACRSGAGFSDAAGYTREALVIETDEASAAEIEQQLATHLEARKTQFRSYDPEAYAIAGQGILLRDGGVVLFLVAPEAQAMKAVFDAVER